MDNIELHINKKWFITFFPKYKNKQYRQLNKNLNALTLKYTKKDAQERFKYITPQCYGFTIDKTSHIFLFKYNLINPRYKLTPLKQIIETISHETIHIVLSFDQGNYTSMCWDNIANNLNDYLS